MSLSSRWRNHVMVAAVVGCGGSAVAQATASTSGPTIEELAPKEFDSYWLVLLERPATYAAGSQTQPEVARAQIEHLQYLRRLARERVILANGPFETKAEDSIRGMVLLRGDLSRQQIDELFSADPHVRRGAFKPVVLRWMTAKGSVQWPSVSPW